MLRPETFGMTLVFVERVFSGQHGWWRTRNVSMALMAFSCWCTTDSQNQGDVHPDLMWQIHTFELCFKWNIHW